MTDAGAATASGAASASGVPVGGPVAAGEPAAADARVAVGGPVAAESRGSAGVAESATAAGHNGLDAAATASAEPIPAQAGGDHTAVRPSAGRAAVDLAMRIVGGAVAVLLAVITAVAEIFYSPLRLGGVLIGVSVVIAVVINFWLLRYTVAVTGARWPALFPPLVWFGVMMVGSGRSTEGDLLLADNNWVALVTIFAGSLAFAVAGYRLILPPAPRPPVARADDARPESDDPAGPVGPAGPGDPSEESRDQPSPR